MAHAPLASVRAAVSFGERPLALTVPAPVAPPSRLLDVDGFADAFVWQPSQGPHIAALGAAQRVVTEGPNRCTQAVASVERILGAVESVAPFGVSPIAPKLYGGFAFEPHMPPDSPWARFGPLDLVLPEWTYTVDGDRAHLTAILDPGVEVPARLTQTTAWDLLPAAGRRILAALEQDPATSDLGPVEVNRPDPDDWARAISAVHDAIRDGEVAKVVLSRRTSVKAARRFEPRAVVEQLLPEPSAAVRFAVRRGESTFVGVTPERLVKVSGNEVEADAMAGTCRPNEAAERALLASDKDAEEHRFVVDMVAERLGTFSEGLEVPKPKLKRLTHVTHLYTPIRGQLPEARHVLELAEALHPTPATGGVPTAAARAFLAEHEHEPRGWYTGGVGWVDGAGDGEFWVALRSGLLQGTVAHVFAGAGIVRQSQADLELREIEAKAQAVLRGLGVVR